MPRAVVLERRMLVESWRRGPESSLWYSGGRRCDMVGGAVLWCAGEALLVHDVQMRRARRLP